VVNAVYGYKGLEVVLGKRRLKNGALGYFRADFRKRQTPIPFGVTTMAGSVAEYLWHGAPPGFVSAGDLKILRDHGFGDECFPELWAIAVRLLRKRKRRVWRLAARLARHGYVDLRNGRY
jgi:hypothetical protein